MDVVGYVYGIGMRQCIPNGSIVQSVLHIRSSSTIELAYHTNCTNFDLYIISPVMSENSASPIVNLGSQARFRNPKWRD